MGYSLWGVFPLPESVWVGSRLAVPLQPSAGWGVVPVPITALQASDTAASTARTIHKRVVFIIVFSLGGLVANFCEMIAQTSTPGSGPTLLKTFRLPPHRLHFGMTAAGKGGTIKVLSWRLSACPGCT